MTTIETKRKELAEWYGFNVVKYYKDSLQIEDDKSTGEFEPDKDSNQLDMLEDKVIQESEYNGIYLCPKEKGWNCSYCIRNTPHFIEADGKTKNEARLNAIYNYIKSLSKKC